MYELAVSYSRFSSDNQDVKSANDQDIENTEYANRNGIKIIQYFRDEAKSGRKTVGRDGFFDMLDFCKRYNKDSTNIDKIKYVLVWKFNRFARNDLDSSIFKNTLRKLGIRVISITQKIDDTPEGHLLEGFLQNIDAYFSENLSVDIKRGLKNNAKEFKFNGGTPPLGYEIVNQKYEIKQTEALVVKMIFQKYLSGKSLMDIAIELNNLGYKTRFNQNFKATSIFEILSNKKYIGIYEYKMQGETYTYEDVIPAIISKEDFRRVLEMRENNKKHKGFYSAKENYLLSGLIFCKECGKSYIGMTSTRKKGEKTYKYRKYGCNGRNKLYGCKNVYLNADSLEKYAFNLLKEKIGTKEGIENIKAEVNEFLSNMKQGAKSNSTETEKELRAVNKKINNCMEAVMNGLKSNELNSKIENLEHQKELLEEELLFSQKCETRASINVDTMLAIIEKQFENYDNYSIEEKKMFFKTYIRKIEVDHLNITFYFNLKSLDIDSISDMEPLVRMQVKWQISIVNIINY